MATISEIGSSENKTRKAKNKKNSVFKVIMDDAKEWFKQGKKHGTVDLPFFFIVITLLVTGVIMMFSASYALAIGEGKPGTFYAIKQMKYAGLGFAGMFVLSKIDYHLFQKKIIAFGLFIVCWILLVVILIPPLHLGVTLNESTRWFGIGGFSFQPSEVMKFSIIILFSTMIVNNFKRMEEFKVGVLPFLIILVSVAGPMLLEPHLSATIIMISIGVIMLFIGGAKKKHLIFTGLAGAGALALVVLYKINVSGVSYFEKRFQSWLDPFSDIQGNTWQTYQSLVAIGSGGLFGMGLGNSRQKFQYLPESENDFVFSIGCEELGFVGAVTIIILFAFLVFRGFYIASKAPDKFGMLMCIGLTVQVGLQAFINISVVSNLIPNTGISLPFFSYGGTSLFMLMSQMGVVLNISRQVIADETAKPDKNKKKRKFHQVKK